MPRLTPSFPPLVPFLSNDQSHMLCRHLKQCEKARGRWFGFAVVAERLHGVIAPRLATTVGAAGLALGLALHWL